MQYTNGVLRVRPVSRSSVAAVSLGGLRNEQQFQVTFSDDTIRTIGADRYRIDGGILTFFEDLGPGTPEHAVASFPMDVVASVVRSDPAVEYLE